MRPATTRFGAALMLAATSLVFTHATSIADPGTHQVVYTVASDMDEDINLNYLAAEPQNKAALDANPSAFWRNERQRISPGAPWVSAPITMSDTSWAFVRAGGAAHYNGSPSLHCDITIDGQSQMHNDGDTATQCALKPW
jgi:hypothetical protein